MGRSAQCNDMTSPGKASVLGVSRVPLVVHHKHSGLCSVSRWCLDQRFAAHDLGSSPRELSCFSGGRSLLGRTTGAKSSYMVAEAGSELD